MIMSERFMNFGGPLFYRVQLLIFIKVEYKIFESDIMVLVFFPFQLEPTISFIILYFVL